MTRKHLTIFGLVAVMAVSSGACGDDDDATSGQDDGAATAEADAPAPAGAFGGLRQALEAQGLVVTDLPKASLEGAEDGVEISGSESGSARLFSTEPDAKAYADTTSAEGDETVVVGTAVFQSKSQADAQSFAEAYEGG